VSQTGPDAGVDNGMGCSGAGQKHEKDDQKHFDADQQGPGGKMGNVVQGKSEHHGHDPQGVEFACRMKPGVEVRHPYDAHGTACEEKQSGQKEKNHQYIHILSIFISGLFKSGFFIKPLSFVKIPRGGQNGDKVEKCVGKGNVDEHIHPLVKKPDEQQQDHGFAADGVYPDEPVQNFRSEYGPVKGKCH